jgi:hypothetical protein
MTTTPSKVDELVKVTESNVDAELGGGKPDWKLQAKLQSELTIVEQLEFDLRKRAQARKCWERGDIWRRYLWEPR